MHCKPHERKLSQLYRSGLHTNNLTSSEADIGISAANLALSRMIYLYFTRDRSQRNKSRISSAPTSDSARYPSSRGKATLHSQNTYSLLGSENQTEFGDQIPLTAVKKLPTAVKDVGNGQLSG